MRAIDLDFRRDERHTPWAGFLLLALGGASVLAAGHHHGRLKQELEQAEAWVRPSGPGPRTQSVGVRNPGDVQKVALEYRRATEVAAQLRLPWNDLFMSVELASTPDVALLSIESDIGKRQVRIAGESKDFDALLGYLRLLARQPTLENIYLQSHRVQQQDPQHPVLFVLSADWVSARAAPGQTITDDATGANQ